MSKRNILAFIIALQGMLVSLPANADNADNAPAPRLLGLTLGYSTVNDVENWINKASQSCRFEKRVENGAGFIKTENCAPKLNKWNKMKFYFTKGRLHDISITIHRIFKRDQKNFYKLIRKNFGPAWSVERQDLLTSKAEWRFPLYEIIYESDVGRAPDYLADKVHFYIELKREFFFNNENIEDYTWWTEPGPDETFSDIFN